MKKKVLIIILVVLFVLLVILLINRINSNKKPDQNTFVKTSETSSDKSEQNENIKKYTKEGQNKTVIIGQTDAMGDHFTNINVKINDSQTKEGSVKALIQGISDAIGYTIEVNSVTIDGNDIRIDFSSAAAPQQNETSYYGFGSEAYHILSPNGVAKTIFDSINKTLKNIYGEETNIYYSIDDNDVLIDNITPIIQLNKNEIYK